MDFDGDDENDGVLGRKAPSEKGKKSDPVLQATTTAGSNSIKSESLSVPELVQKPVTEAVGNEKWVCATCTLINVDSDFCDACGVERIDI